METTKATPSPFIQTDVWLTVLILQVVASYDKSVFIIIQGNRRN